MVPFYWWGSTASRLESLQGDSLPFTTKFAKIPGTHSIDLGRMKGFVKNFPRKRNLTLATGSILLIALPAAVAAVPPPMITYWPLSGTGTADTTGPNKKSLEIRIRSP